MTDRIVPDKPAQTWGEWIDDLLWGSDREFDPNSLDPGEHFAYDTDELHDEPEAAL